MQYDLDVMSYKEIAERLGLAHAASAKHIYERALRKLRWHLQGREEEFRDLYMEDPERSERPEENWRVSELPLSRFPLQPRKIK